jgi:hypothetical protein
MALGRVMTAGLKDDTQLFKQFSDNPAFRAWLVTAFFNDVLSTILSIPSSSASVVRPHRSASRPSGCRHGHSQPCAHLMVDLDSCVNAYLETHGHRIGDFLLQGSGRRPAGDAQEQVSVINENGGGLAGAAFVEDRAAYNGLIRRLARFPPRDDPVSVIARSTHIERGMR